MWRRRGHRLGEVLRLGAESAQRYRHSGGGLHLVAEHEWLTPGVPPMDVVAGAIEGLWREPIHDAVTAVIESAWLPLMLVDTGGAGWRMAFLEALLRHRFSLLYDDAGTTVAEWDVRVDHRPGETWALGYGCSPRLMATLTESARKCGFKWRAVEPGWSWGWQLVRPSLEWPGGNGYWAWREQDRVLLGRFSNGRPVMLNTAAVGCNGPAAIEAAVEIEARRNGWTSDGLPVVVADWCSPGAAPTATPRVRWACLVQGSAVEGRAA